MKTYDTNVMKKLLLWLLPIGILTFLLLSFSCDKEIPNGTYNVIERGTSARDVKWRDVRNVKITSIKVEGDTSGVDMNHVIDTVLQMTNVNADIPKQFGFCNGNMTVTYTTGKKKSILIRYTSSKTFVAGKNTYTYSLKKNGRVSLSYSGCDYTLKRIKDGCW